MELFPGWPLRAPSSAWTEVVATSFQNLLLLSNTVQDVTTAWTIISSGSKSENPFNYCLSLVNVLATPWRGNVRVRKSHTKHCCRYRIHIYFLRSEIASKHQDPFYTTVLGFLIIESRPGPTPIQTIGTPSCFSIYSTYALQFFGNSSYVLHFSIEVSQPGRLSY